MKLVGKCFISKKKAKEGFEYPIVRFPKEYSELIGKAAKIYEIDKNKFLISVDENSEDKLFNELDNSYVLAKIDKNLLEKARIFGIDINSFIENQLRELLNGLEKCSGRDLNPGHRLERPV